MPTYDYVCEKCGHQFEKFQSISAAPLESCPQDVCPKPRWGKGKVRRAISAGAGLIFKGSGFYITDYRSDSYKEAAKKETSSTKPPATSESKSSGESSKPAAAKSESKASSKKKE